MKSAEAGRPNGHVPGHSYLDCEIEVAGYLATLTIKWGIEQGRGVDGEQGREEYTRSGMTDVDAVTLVRDAALDEQQGESRRYIEMAASRLLRELNETPLGPQGLLSRIVSRKDGATYVRDTDVLVSDIVKLLKVGASVSDILGDFRDLEAADVDACALWHASGQADAAKD